MATKQFRESSELAAFLQRMAKALVKRAGEGDLDALAAIRQARKRLADAEKEAADALHYDRGYEWSVIGATLGITKQAAQKQFGREDEDE